MCFVDKIIKNNLSVADKKNTWKSFLRVASLHYNPTTEKATITWFNTDDNPISLLSRFSNGFSVV